MSDYYEIRIPLHTVYTRCVLWARSVPRGCSLWNLIRHVGQVARKKGLTPAAGFILTQLLDRHYERKYGINTSSYVNPSELGHPNAEYTAHAGSDYPGLRKTLKALEIRGGKDVFLDMGSGLGRVVITAATFPFRKVIGVEISSALNALAAANVDRARRRLRCQDIELVTMDATRYSIPPEVTVVYFYSPCVGKSMRQVFANLHQSLREAPRNLTIVYRNVTEFTSLVHELPWLSERRRVRGFYGHDYHIYEASNPVA